MLSTYYSKLSLHPIVSVASVPQYLPSITYNGTHYLANMRLSLELLKEMCESQEGLVRITGDYTGGICVR